MQLLGGEVEGLELGGGDFGFFALEFVDDLEEFGELPFAEAFVLSEFGPGVAVGEADLKVVGGETEFAHGVDGERNEFGVGRGGVVAEDVGVELIELASAAFLRGFVAKALPDFEPLEGFGILALLGGGEAGEGGGDFGTEGHVAVALVLEAKKLGGEFATRFLEVEFGGFEEWGFVFDKAVTGGDAAPGLEEIVAHLAVARIKVAKAGKCLEACCHRKSSERGRLVGDWGLLVECRPPSPRLRRPRGAEG